MLRMVWLRQLVVLIAAFLASGCTATPMPEPPSVDASRMTLVADGPDSLTLQGSPGSINLGSTDLRVTNPRLDARALTVVSPDGQFSVALAGVRSDSLYLEVVREASDDFLIALTGGPDTAVAEVDPGPDQDGDESPDAVDCAPGDSAVGGRRCASLACATDADCPPDAVCVAGLCTTGCVPEVCGNGVDDDCDGQVDDGCVACDAVTPCPAGQSCQNGWCA